MKTIKLKEWAVLDCWCCGKLSTVYYIEKQKRNKRNNELENAWGHCDDCFEAYMAQKPKLKNYKIKKVVVVDAEEDG